MNERITMVVCGAGLAGMRTTLAVARSNGLADCLTRVSICDYAAIRGHNVLTCPQYTTVGQPKCERLAELVRPALDVSVRVDAMQCRVEEMDWRRALPSGADERRIVLVCLDCWEGRLAVAEDVRVRAGELGAEVTLIQVGLDRGLASVAVFGSGFVDPCPACGHVALPGSEPCVVFAEGGQLMRGNLRAEARAAGRVVRDIMRDMAGLASSPRDWTNRKINVVVRDGGKWIEQHLRDCRVAADCFGPHSAAAPLRWEQLPQVASNDGGYCHD